jgi:phosphonate metabolism protein PhnN/1,5-bisphosphokinase (PRPP-forming)
MPSASAHGTLFLVVGPSGAGKDTLLDGARDALAGDQRYHFARRTITRPADAGGEAHAEVSPAEFARLKVAGAFALDWGAHDLRYGIALTETAPLAHGRHVIANASRGILDEARAAFAPVIIVSVIVPPDVLRARLEARGREIAADIDRRLARAAALEVIGPDVRYVMNDGTVAAGVASFLDVLASAAP